jgi:hypothetical protein
LGGSRAGQDRPPARPRSRRPRTAPPRGRTVRFALTDAELADLDHAAARAGLARGAYAARTVLAAARGQGGTPGDDRLRELLAELITAAGLARRIGVNLNQAVARLNATGQYAGDLPACAAEAVRRAARLDETADRVRKALR